MKSSYLTDAANTKDRERESQEAFLERSARYRPAQRAAVLAIAGLYLAISDDLPRVKKLVLTAAGCVSLTGNLDDGDGEEFARELDAILGDKALQFIGEAGEAAARIAEGIAAAQTFGSVAATAKS